MTTAPTIVGIDLEKNWFTSSAWTGEGRPCYASTESDAARQ